MRWLGVDSHGATRARSAASSKRAWKRGELFERDCAGVGRHAPFAVGRELASACPEILEQEHEGVVVVARPEVAPGDQQLDGGGDVGVELGLAVAHADGADHLPVHRVERRQLHEQRRRPRVGGGVGEPEAGALVGGEGVVEQLDVGDLGAQRLRHPGGGQVGGVGGKRLHGRTLPHAGDEALAFGHGARAAAAHARRVRGGHRLGDQARRRVPGRRVRAAPAARRATPTAASTSTVVAERLGMPIAHDEAHGLWALGPRSGDRKRARQRAHARARPPRLRRRRVRRREPARPKVVLVAWASW